MHPPAKPLARRLRQPLVRAIVLAIALLFAIRVIWGFESQYRLNKVRAQLRAQGVQLDPPIVAVPDSHNAALPTTSAIHAVSLTPEEERIIRQGSPADASVDFAEVSWDEAGKPELRRILAKQAAAFAHMRLAATLPQARWPETTAGLDVHEQHPIHRSFKLAFVLYAAAVLSFDDGQPTQTLDYFRLILELSRIIDHDPAPNSHLVAASMRTFTAHGIERFASQMQFSDGDGSSAAAQKLIALLADDQHTRQANAFAWENEIKHRPVLRYFGRDAILKWWFQPLLDDEKARLMLTMARDMPSVRADNWQTAFHLLPKRTHTSRTMLDDRVLFTSPYQVGSSLMYTSLHFPSLAASRAAWVLLAARIFEARHGRRPAGLNELVPELLPAVPLDPFAADARPLRFRNDPTGITLWSVGENGTDEEAHDLPKGFRAFRYGGGRDPRDNPLDIVYGAAWRTVNATVP
jgi:hypothetical protein